VSVLIHLLVLLLSSGGDRSGESLDGTAAPDESLVVLLLEGGEGGLSFLDGGGGRRSSGLGELEGGVRNLELSL
jgi:hypothetical protein